MNKDRSPFRVYLEPDGQRGGGGVGCLLCSGAAYYPGFGDLEEARTFLPSLCAVKPEAGADRLTE